MTLNRRECLRTLALAFTPTPSVVYSERVLDDLWAATEPDAMPALDWGDLSAVVARWGRSTWSHVVTGHHCDLQSMLHDSITATAQQVSPERPSTAIVVLRGESGLHLDQCRAVSGAFHSEVPTCSELWFAAAPAPALVDKLRLTVVVSG
ncbi:hypothetical protein QF021_002270 [Acidovorax delafieldii]|uniref:hypothetical protein n=1 Tax=Acidovorax delafieldii TaxID=47920 RepID=UPI0028649BE4|nr:hypothetical protein [Acidovorax delafieldii]MDR6154181.1 hypothetical protein [Acidovorax delafieldii]